MEGERRDGRVYGAQAKGKEEQEFKEEGKDGRALGSVKGKRIKQERRGCGRRMGTEIRKWKGGTRAQEELEKGAH